MWNLSQIGISILAAIPPAMLVAGLLKLGSDFKIRKSKQTETMTQQSDARNIKTSVASFAQDVSGSK